MHLNCLEENWASYIACEDFLSLPIIEWLFAASFSGYKLILATTIHYFVNYYLFTISINFIDP